MKNSQSVSWQELPVTKAVNVNLVLLHSLETWMMTKTIWWRIQTFTNYCPRRILNIKLQDKTKNEVVWERAGQEPLNLQIMSRIWKQAGHTLRKPDSSMKRQAMTQNLQGNRNRRSPRTTWRRDYESALRQGINMKGSREKNSKQG